MISNDFERAFRTACLGHEQELLDQAKLAEESSARLGVVFRNKDFPLLPRVTLLTGERRDELADVSEALIDLLEKVIRLYARDGAVQRFFMLKERWAQLIALTPELPRHIRISRFDGYLVGDAGTLKVLENNTDCPAGLIFTGRLNGVLTRLPLVSALLETFPPVRSETIDRPDAFVQELLNAHDEFSGGRRPAGVAVLQIRGQASPEAQELTKLFQRRGLTAVICDPRDMQYLGGRLQVQGQSIDLVWNKINTAHLVPLLEAPDGPEDYLSACRDGAVCQPNSFAARFITESKLCLAFLSDTAHRHHFTAPERCLIDRHIPWSRRLTDQESVEFRGERFPLRDLVKVKQQDLVLKAAYDIRGDGVTVGRSIPQAQWLSLVERSWDQPFVLQEFIAPPQVDVICPGPPPVWQSLNFSVDLFMGNGCFMGFGSKVSPHLKVNVFQGGSKQVLQSLAEPLVASGRLLKVFSGDPQQGNPALVVDSPEVTVDRALALARRSGTVTTWVTPSQVAEVRMRFFTSTREMPFCAHGLLAGAFSFSRSSGRTHFRVEVDGRVVEVSSTADGMVAMRCPGEVKVYRPPCDARTALAMLGLRPEHLAREEPFCVASIGSEKLLLPIVSWESLRSARPHAREIAAWSERSRVNGIYAYCIGPGGDQGPDIYARGLNPLFGADEDGGTGVAAGALAAVLALRRRAPAALRVRQGQVIGRTSDIHVRADDLAVTVSGPVTPAGRVRCQLSG